MNIDPYLVQGTVINNKQLECLRRTYFMQVDPVKLKEKLLQAP